MVKNTLKLATLLTALLGSTGSMAALFSENSLATAMHPASPSQV